MRKFSVVAALLAAVQASAGWTQTAPEPPKILVDGYGEVQTMPDVAIINYNVRGEGSTSDDAVRAMTAFRSGQSSPSPPPTATRFGQRI